MPAVNFGFFAEEGLLDLGTFPTSLVGSKLRNAGWATNEAAVDLRTTTQDSLASSSQSLLQVAVVTDGDSVDLPW